MINLVAAFNLGRYYNELAHQKYNTGADIELDYIKTHINAPETGIEIAVTLKGTPKPWGTIWWLASVKTEAEADIFIAECKLFVGRMDSARYKEILT